MILLLLFLITSRCPTPASAPRCRQVHALMYLFHLWFFRVKSEFNIVKIGT